MPESIVGILKSFKECWPCLFASNIIGKTKKQVRGIRITEAIIIGLVLAGGAELRDSKKSEMTAILKTQEEIKVMIETKDIKTNRRLDDFNIVLQNMNGRVSRLEGTINSWEVDDGN